MKKKLELAIATKFDAFGKIEYRFIDIMEKGIDYYEGVEGYCKWWLWGEETHFGYTTAITGEIYDLDVIKATKQGLLDKLIERKEEETKSYDDKIEKIDTEIMKLAALEYLPKDESCD